MAAMPLADFLDILPLLLTWSRYRLLSAANHSGVSRRRPRLPGVRESEMLHLISL